MSRDQESHMCSSYMLHLEYSSFRVVAQLDKMGHRLDQFLVLLRTNSLPLLAPALRAFETVHLLQQALHPQELGWGTGAWRVLS